MALLSQEFFQEWPDTMNNSNADASLTACDLLIRNIHLATMDPARTSTCPYNSISQGAILVQDGKIPGLDLTDLGQEAHEMTARLMAQRAAALA